MGLFGRIWALRFGRDHANIGGFFDPLRRPCAVDAGPPELRR